MKLMFLILLLAGYTAKAGNTDNPGRNLTNCKFNKVARFNSTITYKDQNGTPLKEMVALQIKDGAFVEVARPTPAWVPAP